MIRDMILKNRSYRRFYQNFSIDMKTLRGLVELARFSASAGNFQPLKFILSFREDRNHTIFKRLSWAAYLKDWPGPREGERPSAYIVILGDTKIFKGFKFDAGIAAQSILLGAVEKGLGGCILASIDRDGLRRDLAIDTRYEILLVIALGRPKEKVVIEDMDHGQDIKYWRDEKGVHHVPKRPLDELILDI